MADVNLAPSREVDFHPRLDVREIAVIILVPIMAREDLPLWTMSGAKGYSVGDISVAGRDMKVKILHSDHSGMKYKFLSPWAILMPRDG
jgi:hypothetical protein